MTVEEVTCTNKTVVGRYVKQDHNIKPGMDILYFIKAIQNFKTWFHIAHSKNFASQEKISLCSRLYRLDEIAPSPTS